MRLALKPARINSEPPLIISLGIFNVLLCYKSYSTGIPMTNFHGLVVSTAPEVVGLSPSWGRIIGHEFCYQNDSAGRYTDLK